MPAEQSCDVVLGLQVVGCFRPTGKTHAVMTLGSQTLHPTQASPAEQAFPRSTGGLPSGLPVKLE